MPFLSAAAKEDIAKQISSVEAKTNGEILTVIAQSSDDYRYLPILWAALIALCVPGIFYILQAFQQQSWQEVGAPTAANWVYTIQALVFLALASLFQWTPLRLWLIPESVKRKRASRNATVQFLSQQVHWAPHRAGILIFVSVAERYVEIIVDQAVAAKTDNATWRNTVDHFINDVRADNVAAGFHQAIEDCGAVLVRHFPISPAGNQAVDQAGNKGNRSMSANHLPNHLIEV